MGIETYDLKLSLIFDICMAKKIKKRDFATFHKVVYLSCILKNDKDIKY